MSRIVRCSLIQATNAAPPEASLEVTKKAMIDKHVAYIEQAADGRRTDCLPAGDLLRAVLLRGTDHQVVRLHGADARTARPSG